MAETGWRGVNESYLESSGDIPPVVHRLQIVDVVPWTRWQRRLHRLGICRWHRHPATWIDLGSILGGDRVVDRWTGPRITRDG